MSGQRQRAVRFGPGRVGRERTNPSPAAPRPAKRSSPSRSTQTDGGHRVPAERGRAATLGIVSQCATRQPPDPGKTVGYPLDRTESGGGCAQRRGQETWQQRSRYLMPKVSEETGSPDPDHAASEPAIRRRLRIGSREIGLTIGREVQRYDALVGQLQVPRQDGKATCDERVISTTFLVDDRERHNERRGAATSREPRSTSLDTTTVATVSTFRSNAHRAGCGLRSNRGAAYAAFVWRRPGQTPVARANPSAPARSTTDFTAPKTAP